MERKPEINKGLLDPGLQAEKRLEEQLFEAMDAKTSIMRRETDIGLIDEAGNMIKGPSHGKAKAAIAIALSTIAAAAVAYWQHEKRQEEVKNPFRAKFSGKNSPAQVLKMLFYYII